MASFPDYYALSFNPFDKQCLKEKDGFQSSDFKQMDRSVIDPDVILAAVNNQNLG